MSKFAEEKGDSITRIIYFLFSICLFCFYLLIRFFRSYFMVSCNENIYGLTFGNNYLSLLNNLTIEADNVNSDAS